MIKCQRCNRKLKTDLSVQRGYGPVCFAKIQEQKSKIVQQETPIFLTQSALENVENYVKNYIQPKTSLLATTKKIFNKIWAVKNNSDSYYKKHEIRTLNHLIATPI